MSGNGEVLLPVGDPEPETTSLGCGSWDWIALRFCFASLAFSFIAASFTSLYWLWLTSSKRLVLVARIEA